MLLRDSEKGSEGPQRHIHLWYHHTQAQRRGCQACLLHPPPWAAPVTPTDIQDSDETLGSQLDLPGCTQTQLHPGLGTGAGLPLTPETRGVPALHFGSPR